MEHSLFQDLIQLLPAETSHKVRMRTLSLVGKLPTGLFWLRRLLSPRKADLGCEVFGTHFRNPIGVAAGFDINGDCLKELNAIGFGFVEIGSVLPRPQHGSPRPRISYNSQEQTYIDASGYPSKGLDYVLTKVRKRHKSLRNMVLGCNISKMTSTSIADTPKEYLRVFRNMYQYVDYFTINGACNTSKKRYMPTTYEELQDLLEPLFEFRRGQLDYRPILLKISPDLTNEQLDTIISFLIKTPLDGIVAVTGSLDMNSNENGVLCGAKLTERAIEIVRYISEKTHGNYPIIGSGGMITPEDVVRMKEAGATLVSLNCGLREHGFRLFKEASMALMPKPDPVAEPTPDEAQSATDRQGVEAKAEADSSKAAMSGSKPEMTKPESSDATTATTTDQAQN